MIEIGPNLSSLLMVLVAVIFLAFVGYTTWRDR